MLLAQEIDRELRVMFWNLENFFDFLDGGAGESDAEFSATGPRRWTKKRFYRKCHAVAKTILWAGSLGREGGGYAGLPDVVGMAEVENRFVLKQLVDKTALRKLDYEIVHFDSPDPRGIDCALLYRASRLTLVSAKPCRVSAEGLQTRDILLAQFLTPAGDSLAVLVNHHPSKYGGGETDWRREVAVDRLRALGDSLAADGWSRIVAVGDFNDTPDNPLFERLSPSLSLCRLSAPSASLFPDGTADGPRQLTPRPVITDPFRENVRLSAPSASLFPDGTADGSRLLNPLLVSADPFRENVRLSAVPPGNRNGIGSIRFNGEWQLIDLCFVSPALAGASSFSVLEPPFLTERDAAHSGDRPLRTYSGPRYRGGVSDHRPILVRLSLSSPPPASPPPALSLLASPTPLAASPPFAVPHPASILSRVAPLSPCSLASPPLAAISRRQPSSRPPSRLLFPASHRLRIAPFLLCSVVSLSSLHPSTRRIPSRRPFRRCTPSLAALFTRGYVFGLLYLYKRITPVGQLLYRYREKRLKTRNLRPSVQAHSVKQQLFEQIESI